MAGENDPEFEKGSRAAPIFANDLERQWRSTHLLREEVLLPALCPLCGAGGVCSLRLPAISSAQPWWSLEAGRATKAQEAYFCEICAEMLQKSLTRRFAVKAATLVVSLALSSACALFLGSRAVPVQYGLAVVFCIFLSLAFQALGALRAPFYGLSTLPLEAEDPEGSQRVLCEVEKFSRVLVAHGAAEVEESESLRMRSGVLKSVVPFALGLAAANWGWLFMIHQLGVAKIRVVTSGTRTAVFLVDSRVFGEIQATNSEDPRAGRLFEVLGGRRRFQLFSKNGASLADVELTVWPGANYLVGHLPADYCLFWEQRSYGDKGQGRRFTELEATGPVFRLDRSVDSWFLALGDAAASEGALPLSTSGGIRNALRLLPCTFQGGSESNL